MLYENPDLYDALLPTSEQYLSFYMALARRHLRSIFPEELGLLVAAQQFRLVRRDGDLMGGAFTAASPRQVCLCQPF